MGCAIVYAARKEENALHKVWADELEELTHYKESELTELASKLVNVETKKKIDMSVEKENTFLPLSKSSTKVSPS